jgi:hypothetical protein
MIDDIGSLGGLPKFTDHEPETVPLDLRMKAVHRLLLSGGTVVTDTRAYGALLKTGVLPTHFYYKVSSKTEKSGTDKGDYEKSDHGKLPPWPGVNFDSVTEDENAQTYLERSVHAYKIYSGTTLGTLNAICQMHTENGVTLRSFAELCAMERILQKYIEKKLETNTIMAKYFATGGYRSFYLGFTYYALFKRKFHMRHPLDICDEPIFMNKMTPQQCLAMVQTMFLHQDCYDLYEILVVGAFGLLWNMLAITVPPAHECKKFLESQKDGFEARKCEDFVFNGSGKLVLKKK